jgi:hypothetical protein
LCTTNVRTLFRKVGLQELIWTNWERQFIVNYARMHQNSVELASHSPHNIGKIQIGEKCLKCSLTTFFLGVSHNKRNCDKEIEHALFYLMTSRKA